MGHTQPGNGQIVQHFQALGYGIFNMAYWERRGGPILYLRGNHDAVKAFRFVNGQFQPTPFTTSGFTAGLPYDGLAISANGSAQYSAILWVTSTLGGDNNGPGTLHALSAMDLSKELWNSDMNAARDSLGILAKYTAPTIANGKVYVPTFANKLVVYGLFAQKQLIGDWLWSMVRALGRRHWRRRSWILQAGSPGVSGGRRFSSMGQLHRWFMRERIR
jgi:hypothetical protein